MTVDTTWRDNHGNRFRVGDVVVPVIMESPLTKYTIDQPARVQGFNRKRVVLQFLGSGSTTVSVKPEVLLLVERNGLPFKTPESARRCACCPSRSVVRVEDERGFCAEHRSNGTQMNLKIN